MKYKNDKQTIFHVICACARTIVRIASIEGNMLVSTSINTQITIDPQKIAIATFPFFSASSVENFLKKVLSSIL